MAGLAPATSLEEFTAQVIERHPALSPQLQKIGRYMLDHPGEVAFATVAELARHAEVQPSAIIRFAQAFGHDGFTSVQRIYRSVLKVRLDSMQDRVRTLGMLHREGATTTIAEEVIGGGAAALDRLRAGLDQAEIDRAADLLAAAPHIYVLAQGKPFPIACYLNFALLRLKRPCTLLAGIGGVLAQQVELSGPSDVLVVASFRPYSEQVVRLAAERHEAGMTVIAITDSAVSPLWRSARAAFQVVEQDGPVFQSLIGPLCLAQILVMSLGHRLMREESR